MIDSPSENAMSDKLAQPNEQTADSAADSPAAPTAEDTAVSAEVNANGHLLPHNWKGTIAVVWSGQAASVLATCAATFAVLWYVTTSEDSALAACRRSGVAALLPTALLAPFGGRCRRTGSTSKRLMIAADGTAGAFSLVPSPLLALAGALPLCLAFGAAAHGALGRPGLPRTRRSWRSCPSSFPNAIWCASTRSTRA